MNLTRLLYISDAVGNLSTREVARIVETAKVRNESRGITGILLYSGGHFMQMLEGDPQLVPTLYNRICQDPRHTEHRILLHKATDRRLFPEWGMQLVTTDRSKDLDRDRIDRSLLRLRMNATETDATQAIALLQEFRTQFLTGAA